jgi:hypothetical protein
MSETDIIKPDSFAEGLKKFFTRSSIVEPVRLNKRMKEIIFLLIEEDLENSVILFSEESGRYDSFMNSMNWLKQKITGDKTHNIIFNKKIGAFLYFWVCDKKYHYLSDDKNFDKAMQWILNKINKKWSIINLFQKYSLE